MPNLKPKISYFHTGYYPVFVGAAFSIKELEEEYKRLNVPLTGFSREETTDAYTITLEDKDGARICIVYMNMGNIAKHNSYSEYMGICTHEAVHVWQSVKEYIGEVRPGEEQEAYYIQNIAQQLFEMLLKKIKQPNVFKKEVSNMAGKSCGGKKGGKGGKKGK